MRGKQVRKRRPELARRLIPAYAGKTPSLRPGANHLGAHPRVCGENGAIDTAARPALGSSPRMRGKPFLGFRVKGLPRLIPAYAGKTRELRTRSFALPAHPRVCGENSQPTTRRKSPRGSSPRMRGKLHDEYRNSPARRLIPAYAGKTVPTGKRGTS